MNGADRIAAERMRQIEEERWTPAHDEEHVHGELASAAVCYAMPQVLRKQAVRYGIADVSGGRGECAVYGNERYLVPPEWPAAWHPSWWKPTDRITNLVKAGALIAAEIDRLLASA